MYIPICVYIYIYITIYYYYYYYYCYYYVCQGQAAVCGAGEDRARRGAPTRAASEGPSRERGLRQGIPEGPPLHSYTILC